MPSTRRQALEHRPDDRTSSFRQIRSPPVYTLDGDTVDEEEARRKRRRLTASLRTQNGPDQMQESLNPNAEVIDLTEDSTTPSRHTEQEVQAAHTLESLRRVESPRNVPQRSTAASISGLGSKDRPILLDDVDEQDEEFQRKAQVQEEMIRQQELAALDATRREGDRRINFSTMNCVICMDNPTNLTMTACGKLYLPSRHWNFNSNKVARTRILSHLYNGSLETFRTPTT